MSGGDQNWQVGDLALRLSSGQWRDLEKGCLTSDGPAPGSVNRVIGITSDPEGTGLRLEDWPDFVFSATSFRKISPHAADEEDAETIRLLTDQPVQPKTPEPV
ncbi:MAG: hypothetical protein ACOY7L_18185 [Pseudomonadota bacterium]